MMMRPLVLLLLGIAAVVLFAKYIENKSFYFPEKSIDFYPSGVDLPFEDIYITAKDGSRINGWFIPRDNAKHTLLFFHGNAGNIGHRLDKLLILRATGANIFIVDYRGYGKSEGRLSEKGFYLDAIAAYDYLVNERKIAPDRIILYGESLGTAVAIDLASKVRLRAVILEGAFSSGRDMAKRFYPILPAFIFSNQYDSLRKIRGFSGAKLFLHSQEDEIVPFELSKKLYNACQGPKEFAVLAGGHNSAFLDSREKYISSISAFMGKL